MVSIKRKLFCGALVKIPAFSIRKVIAYFERLKLKFMKNMTTELAKQRNRAAAERTLLTWSDSSFRLMGLGIVIDRVFADLIIKAFPEGNRIVPGQASHLLSLSIILLGLGLLALGIGQYQLATRSLQNANYILLSSRPMVLAATTGIVVFGLIAAVVVLLRW